MENGQEPATKQDVFGAVKASEERVIERVTGMLTASEERVIGRVTGMLTASEERVIGRVTGMLTASEERVIGTVTGMLTASEERLTEVMRDIQTEMLKAFYSFTESNHARVTDNERESAALKDRLGILEKRITDLERKVNFPDHPTQ